VKGLGHHIGPECCSDALQRSNGYAALMARQNVRTERIRSGP